MIYLRLLQIFRQSDREAVLRPRETRQRQGIGCRGRRRRGRRAHDGPGQAESPYVTDIRYSREKPVEDIMCVAERK